MATYSQPITIEEYIDAVKNEDAAKLPPSLGGSYVVCVKPFVGSQPAAIDREDLVYIGKTEQNQVLYRATQLLIEELGATDNDADRPKTGTWYHPGGRSIKKEHGNPGARKLFIAWQTDACPSCEEHRVYSIALGSKKFLNQANVSFCSKH
jgi:hypothetical protein